MDDLPEINMIRFSIAILKFVGESKIFATATLRCFRVFNVSMLMIALGFAFTNLFFVDGEMYNQALQSSLFFSHVLLKYLAFLSYKGNIGQLLSDVVNRFWNHRRCNEDVVLEIERISRTVERLQAVYLIMSAFGVSIYLMKPYVAANKGLLLESFVPDSDVVDAILIYSHFHCFCYTIPIVLAYDLIYFGLCVHVVLQFRLLKHRIRDVLSKHDERVKSQIGVCVRHHQYLFTIFWQMRNVYSITLLFHYVGTLISTCTLFFEISLRRTNFTNYIAKIFTILAFVLQFALYAFPAEQVAFEFAGVANTIYESYWYKNTTANQRMLMYMMVVAQRVHYFSGAGLVNINVEAFESTFRKAFSFCAVFRNLIDN